MKQIRWSGCTAGTVLAFHFGLALIASSAWAADRHYELTAESSYLEGCYEPCRCLLMQNESLQGNFVLGEPSGSDDEFVYEVRDVVWEFRQDSGSIPVTGSGVYRTQADQQRLTLALVVGDLREQIFDSGWVPRQATTPLLSIAVALNDFYCYDYVFDVTARPSPVAVRAATWGRIKAIYR